MQVVFQMNLDDFLAIEDVHTVTSEQVQILNHHLSATSHLDIPGDKMERVRDFLIMSLSMEAVEPALVPRLTQLLAELQESQR